MCFGRLSINHAKPALVFPLKALSSPTYVIIYCALPNFLLGNCRDALISVSIFYFVAFSMQQQYLKFNGTLATYRKCSPLFSDIMKILEEPIKECNFYIMSNFLRRSLKEWRFFSSRWKRCTSVSRRIIVLQADASCISHGAIVRPSVDYYYCFLQRNL